MRVLLVSFEEELMSIRYLASALKKSSHTVSVFVEPSLFNDSTFVVSRILSKIFNMEYLFIKKLYEFEPDIVAFSVVTDYFSVSLRYASIVKKFNKFNDKNIKTLFGGIHVTSVPEKVIMNDEVDYICVGEGEEAIVELANKMQKGDNLKNIKNIWLKQGRRIIKNPVRPLITNLDKLGVPDIELYRKSFSPSKYCYGTITSRGCIYQCTYCSNYIYKKIIYKNEKNFYRRHSVESVIAELSTIKRKYTPKLIRFHDDDFIHDKTWFKKFAALYKKEIGIPYFCWANPNSVNEETIKLLKESGCYEVQIGIQTIYSKTREKILDRHMTNQKIKEAIKLFNKSRIYLTVDNIFGIPGQSLKESEDLTLFYLKNMPYKIFMYYLTYYPKLRINDIAYEKGIISKKDIEDIECGKSSMFMYGNKFTKKEHLKLSLILHLVRFGLPLKTARYLIKSGKYKLLPAVSPKYAHFLYKGTRLDFYALRRWVRYKYYIKRKVIDFFLGRTFKYSIGKQES